MHMSAPSPIHNTASPASQITLKKFLQNQINALNITSKDQLKSSQIQAKLAGILNGSGYEVKQVHWHKLNGSDTNRWAELCDGHHHQKPKPAPISELHKPCAGPDCVPAERCEGPECGNFFSRLKNFFLPA